MTTNVAGRLEGKAAIVTGGNSGIGLGAAKLLAAAGAKVIIAARRRSEGEKAVAEITSAGGEALFVETDMMSAASIKAMVEACLDSYGQLDIAFNNAGIPGEVNALIADSNEDSFDQVMAVNVRGVYLSMKYEIPALQKAGGGSIINCSSYTGLRGGQRSGAYYTSKHALIGLTKVGAMEYAKDKIRVNAVCPGLVESDNLSQAMSANPDKFAGLIAKIPMGRPAMVDEIADAVLWLASDESRFVTGTALSVDGGMAI